MRVYLPLEEVEAARTAIESLSDAIQGEETAIDTHAGCACSPAIAVPIVAPFEAEHRAFDLQPGAMPQLTEGSQGQITSKTLGIKGAAGFTQNITCRSSAAAPEGTAEDTATKILKGMGAKTTKRVRVSLYDAWEAQVGTAQSEALVSVVVRPAGLCLIIAEYPHPVSDTAQVGGYVARVCEECRVKRRNASNSASTSPSRRPSIETPWATTRSSERD